MAFDVTAVRARFPALSEGLAQLDGPAGTQMPRSVADAVAGAMSTAVSNRHGPFVSSRRADDIVASARAAVADLVGGAAAGVILGPNMTTITYGLSRALAKTWRAGDEVVLSQLDHDANVRPWLQAAASVGATVRWARVDPDTCELPVEQYDDLLSERTRLVAVTAASNAVGTRPDVRAISDRAHAVGALVHVDGVHATPHAGVDLTALGADFYATSAYKWAGPHVGTTVADPQLLEQLRPDKLLPSADAVPDRFETGTAPFELLAGVTAAVDHLADLDPSAAGSRRQRVLSSMRAVESYEGALLAVLLDGLATLPAVRVLGRPARRTPTVSFTVAGHSPEEVASKLGAQGVCVWHGDYYAAELMRALGRAEHGGAVRAGIVHYTTEDEVRRLLDGLSQLVA